MFTCPPAFTQHLEAQGRAARTVDGYAHDVALFAQWFEQQNHEPLTPATLTPTDVRHYRQHLLKEKIAPATINRHLAALRAYARWAVAAGELDGNPLGDIRGVPEQPHTPRWLDRQQQARLLREAERTLNAARTPAARRNATRNWALIVLLLHTGLRVSEVCALEKDDLTLGERQGRLIVRQGKGGKRREIPLNADARRVLKVWFDLSTITTGRVFRGQRGTPFSISGLNRMLDEYGLRAKVEVSPHTLRHTFAKNLVDAGVPLDQVATLLGHEKLETTRLYTLPGARDLEKAVAMLEG